MYRVTMKLLLMMIADASLHASKPLDLCVTLHPFLHMSCNLMFKCKYSREGILVPGLHCCDLQNVTWLQECMKSNTLNLRVRNGWRMERTVGSSSHAIIQPITLFVHWTLLLHA